LQSLAPTNPHWACVVGYDPFSLCFIHEEGQCASSGGINGLMMMMKLFFAGATHVSLKRVREQIRMTIKTPYLQSRGLYNHYHHDQPINVFTAGTRAFLLNHT
jgi:hypothetical protein